MGTPDTDYIDVVFDGCPCHEVCRFIDTRDANGKSINAGEWIRDGEYYRLRIPQTVRKSANHELIDQHAKDSNEIGLLIVENAQLRQLVAMFCKASPYLTKETQEEMDKMRHCAITFNMNGALALINAELAARNFFKERK